MLLKKRGLNLSFSALNGRPTDQGKLSSTHFSINPGTELIANCPNGAVPVSSERNREKQFYRAKFDKKDCAACPHLKRCIVKEQKRYYMVMITDKKLLASLYRSMLGTPFHQALGDFRAGVEGVPSVLRWAYGVDNLPVRGLIRSRIWDYGKIMAYNFKSFFEYCRKNGLDTLSSSFIFKTLNRFFRIFQVERCYSL